MFWRFLFSLGTIGAIYNVQNSYSVSIRWWDCFVARYHRLVNERQIIIIWRDSSYSFLFVFLNLLLFMISPYIIVFFFFIFRSPGATLISERDRPHRQIKQQTLMWTHSSIIVYIFHSLRDKDVDSIFHFCLLVFLSFWLRTMTKSLI